MGVLVRVPVRTKAPNDPQAAEQAEAKTKAQTEAHMEVQTEDWSGRSQLYLQMNTSKVMTWEEAQAEPTQTYMPLYRGTQSKDQTGTTIWSVLTSEQTEQMEEKTTTQLGVRTATQSTEPTEEQTATQEKAQKVTRSASQAEAQTGAQTVTHAWTDANVQVRTEALTEAEAQTQAEALMQAQIQAKRVVQRPRGGKATVSNYAPWTKIGQIRGKCSVKRQEGHRDGRQQEAQRQDEAGHIGEEERRGRRPRWSSETMDRPRGSRSQTSSRRAEPFRSAMNSRILACSSQNVLRPTKEERVEG